MFPIALCDLNLTGELEKMCQYMCDYLYKKMYIYIYILKKKDSLVCPNEIWWVMWTTEISQQKELLVIIGSF